METVIVFIFGFENWWGFCWYCVFLVYL